MSRPGLCPGARRPISSVLRSQRADLAVSRAGGTVWELAAAGTPSILVPYPHATADHQTLNARWFERGGGAIVVPDDEVAACPTSSRSCSPTRHGSTHDARGNAGARAPGCGRRDRRGARLRLPAERPLAGRRLYFVGIGGSGLSAYANIARAWGAEVRGWDLRDTIFMETLDGRRDRHLGRADPARGVGGHRLDSPRAVASRARPVRRSSPSSWRRDRRSWSPGAHGKTTTAAMIAFALKEAGNDPAWIIGGRCRAARRERRNGCRLARGGG